MAGYYLQHYGIEGQKWGVRRFENEDGTLTEAGKQRYNKNSSNPDYTEKQRFTEKAENDVLIVA